MVTLVAITGSEGAYTVREVFYADDAAFTPATGGVLATGLLFDDTAPDSVDEGDIGIQRMSSRREAYTQIRDAAGNERGANVNASNQLAVAGPVTNAGVFAVQVDAAIPAGTNNIGDVDVLTVPAPLSTTGGGTEATALRVTVATDSTGVLSVDDNGGSLTIDNAQLSVVGNGTAAAAMRVTMANDSTGIVSLTTSTASIGKLAANSGVDIGDVDVLSVNAFVAHDAAIAGNPLIMGGVASAAAPTAVSADQDAVRAWHLLNGAAATVLTAAGALIGGDAANGLDVDVTRLSALVAGSALIGDVGIQGRATGGTSTFRSIDLDETEEEVKATAGTIYSIAAFNLTAAPLYLKLYNLTAANTTVGTSTPTHTYIVPGNADSDGAGFLHTVVQGIAFSTAISAAVTTGVADADTGAPAANACVVDIQYV